MTRRYLLDTLAVGQVLPPVPLSLSAECCLALDLGVSYRDTCRRRRVDEALGGPGGAVRRWPKPEGRRPV